jgi:hypothetical protein
MTPFPVEALIRQAHFLPQLPVGLATTLIDDLVC